MDIKDRFWSKVAITPEDVCWPWLAHRDKDGYGVFATTRGISKRAHRFAYELTHGFEPLDMFVCHSCDNPSCCRPDHLFIGTAKDNSADRNMKGRQAIGVRAKLNSEQVLEIKAALKGGVSQCELGRRYNVCQRTIWMIQHGITWKYV